MINIHHNALALKSVHVGQLLPRFPLFLLLVFFWLLGLGLYPRSDANVHASAESGHLFCCSSLFAHDAGSLLQLRTFNTQTQPQQTDNTNKTLPCTCAFLRFIAFILASSSASFSGSRICGERSVWNRESFHECTLHEWPGEAVQTLMARESTLMGSRSTGGPRSRPLPPLPLPISGLTGYYLSMEHMHRQWHQQDELISNQFCSCPFHVRDPPHDPYGHLPDWSTHET